MFGDRRRLNAVDESLEFMQMASTQFVAGAERQADTVQADRVAGAHRLQDPQRFTSRGEEVLAVHLEPAHVRPGLEDPTEMRCTQPDAGAGR